MGIGTGFSRGPNNDRKSSPIATRIYNSFFIQTTLILIIPPLILRRKVSRIRLVKYLKSVENLGKGSCFLVG